MGHIPLLKSCSSAAKRRFLKDCYKTLEFAFKIESWLKGWLLASIIPIVCAMSINLKLSPMTTKHDNCLVIGPRGSGKRDLLERILAASNPEHFIVLPSKMFESQLVAKGPEYLNNKIAIHEDLIIAFEGTSEKQRKQLEGYWTLALQGKYTRDGTSTREISVVALFGLASEKLDKFREELLSSTFLDRVPPFKHKVSREMKRGILRFRRKPLHQNPAPQPPVIKLPLPEKIDDAKKVNIAFPNSSEIDSKIEEYAMQLDAYEVQTYARAQDYIITFMRANAHLNKRDKVTMSDLLLYDLVHPLFLNSMGELGTENRILSVFKDNPGLGDKELIKKSGYSAATFYRYRKILQGKELI